MAGPKDKQLIINEAWCKGCGICVSFCPKNCLEMVGGKVRLKQDGDCIMCALCEQRCPDYAIFVEDKQGVNK